MFDRLLSGFVAAALLVGPATAFAWNSTRAEAPGQEMQQHGSKPGYPGASGYAPGQEMKQSDRAPAPADRDATGMRQSMTGAQPRPR